MEQLETPALIRSSEITLAAAVVLLDLALPQPLDYSIPLELRGKVVKGSAVLVNLRGKAKKGYVVALKAPEEGKNLVAITEVLPLEESISPQLIELGQWLSTYYLTPLPQVLKTVFPASIRRSQPKEQFRLNLTKTREETRAYCSEIRSSSPLQARVLEILLESKKKLLLTELLEQAEISRSPVDTLQKKGFISLEKVRLFRSPLQEGEYFPTLPKRLSDHQTEALQKITSSLKENIFSPFLLYGVTGSGKTEVYLQAIEKARSLGKGTIMLVPEISLTVQTIERFKSRFSTGIAILHHRLSEGERHDEWERIEKGEASIVIGPRSALFSGVHNLGLIIVDE
jgi:primosomal protein N' (replication factor Y)